MSTVFPLLYPPTSETLTIARAFQALYAIGFKVPMMTNSMQVYSRQAL